MPGPRSRFRHRLALTAASAFAFALAPLAAGCGGGTPAGAGPGDGSPGDPSSPRVFEHDFDTIHLDPGQERTELCASWPLDNPTPIYVSSVSMTAGPGWHHSNWFYVPEGTFSTDDGVWDCSGEFDTFQAALAGGVLFAQSTQATQQTQEFPAGAALLVPAHAVVVGQLHLVNGSDTAIDTPFHMTIDTEPEAAVDTLLRPLAFDFHQLAIPPRQKSRFQADCDMEKAQGGPLDMSIYYVLPHYHRLGQALHVSMIGGDRDGEPVFDAEGGIGEPLGRAMSPPFSLRGATGLRFSCDYDNTTDQTIHFGNADQEMCILLAFTDSPATWGGGVIEGQPTLMGQDGDVAVYQGDCQAIALLR